MDCGDAGTDLGNPADGKQKMKNKNGKRNGKLKRITGSAKRHVPGL